jgi:DNA-binding response OmpR family regulator
MNEPHRVVIIEDDLDLRETVSRYLRLAGMTVSGVGSVLEFYEAVDIRNYDVAVVDLNLPDQSGFTLTGFLRRTTNLGIIIFTAQESITDRVKGYGAGADLYLVKPVDFQELAAAIVSLSQRRRERIAPVPASPPTAWTLDRSSWNLVSPYEVGITLTRQERLLIRALVEADGQAVDRNALFAVLGYAGEQAGPSMNALVRRLRSKIEAATGRSAPIETSYNHGYSFSAPLRFD